MSCNDYKCIYMFFNKNLHIGMIARLGTPFFSGRYVTFFSVLKKECSVLFRSFLEFLATYETQKNVTFFSVLFSSFWRLMRPKRTQRTLRSFAKNRKERKDHSVLLQRTEKNARTFSSFAKERENVPFFFYLYI